MFQEVEANPESLERYIDGMVAACQAKGVTFRLLTDVIDVPDELVPFDRIVIATGAGYRFGLGEPAMVIQRMHGNSQTSDLFHDGLSPWEACADLAGAAAPGLVRRWPARVRELACRRAFPPPI